ncbi:MAG: NAD(+)/NADH kinase [Dehalococcoidia bacterium]
MIEKVGIVYAEGEDIPPVVSDFESALRVLGCDVWSSRAWDDGLESQIPGTELLVCIGGDGTVLRSASVAALENPLILGVNMGRLGFLTELGPHDGLNRLPELIKRSAGRIEERMMLRVEVLSEATGTPPAQGEGPYHALNDVVLGRSGIGRPTYIQATVNGARLASFRADAVIVSTPTGSTAYNMSAGGPIVAPDMKAIIVTPVAPHLSLGKSLVLSASASLELRVATDHLAVMNVDGQGELYLASGGDVRITASPHVARLLRVGEPNDFYTHLSTRLDSLTSRTLQRLTEEELS